MATWVFQGNPDRYDIDSYVARHPELIYWRAEKPDSDEAKTGVRLHEIRLSEDEGYVPRSSAKEDPDPSKAAIVTNPRGTVLRLDPAQASALERLWGLSAPGGVAGDLASATEDEKSSELARHPRRKS